MRGNVPSSSSAEAFLGLSDREEFMQAAYRTRSSHKRFHHQINTSIYQRRASLPRPSTARTGHPAPALTQPAPQHQHQDNQLHGEAVAIRIHRPPRIWEPHQQLEPASGNDGLGLQEKGGSGYSSALSFNRRIALHKELFFLKKFLFKLTDFRSFRVENRAGIARCPGYKAGCRLLGGDPALGAQHGLQGSSQQHPTHSTGHFLPAPNAPPQPLL